VTPSGLVECEVGVSEGRIAEVRKQGLAGERRVKAGSSIVFPGFVDIHVHMREPGWEKKEDFRTGTRAAAHGGVTTVADMPNNPVPIVSLEEVERKRKLAKAKAVVGVELYGGVRPDRLDLIPRLSDDVRAFKVYMSSTTGSAPFPSLELPRAFKAIVETQKPVSLHCEDQLVIDRASRQLEGVDRPDLYSDLRPPEAEAKAVSLAMGSMVGTPKLRANVCHASTRETLELLGEATASGLSVTCEATLHHLYFSRKALEGNRLLQTNPPLRAEDDRAELVRGLRDGRVSFLVTDHAPHLAEEKGEQGLSGVPGLDDYGHMVSWLMKRQGFEPRRVAQVASGGPASYLGLSDRGEISVGKRADLAILDLSSSERVDPDNLQTKCGWSPYEGVEFPGRIRWTFVAGEPVVEDYEVVG